MEPGQKLDPKQKRKLIRGIHSMVAQLPDYLLVQLDEILLDVMSDAPDPNITPEILEIAAEVEKIQAFRAMNPASTKKQ